VESPVRLAVHADLTGTAARMVDVRSGPNGCVAEHKHDADAEATSARTCAMRPVDTRAALKVSVRREVRTVGECTVVTGTPQTRNKICVPSVWWW
jgi:hypothetical protein